jgi:hypothetical protein
VRIKFLIHKLSIVTPRGLTSSSVFIILPFKLKEIFIFIHNSEDEVKPLGVTIDNL